MQAIQRAIHHVAIALFRIFSQLLPISIPVTFAGEDATQELSRAIGRLGIQKVLIVTDKILVELGIVGQVAAKLEAAGVASVVYDGVEPNPTFDQIDAGRALLRSDTCGAVVAIGGGSPMDAAKVIAACGTNSKDPRKLAGMMKIRKRPLPIFALPTTAGTGSEVTIVAVVSDTETHEKKQFIDPKLVPLMTALDPALMAGMPPHVTAATGVDALTHAVESFLSKTSNDQTETYIRMAIPLIFENLPRAFSNGDDLEARGAMAMASYYAGIAFTRTSVGYVHAIAHTFGARYNTPHGLANAITLPHILKFSAPAANERLAALAAMIGIEQGSAEQRADAFRAAVDELLRQLQIPTHLEDLQLKDIPSIAQQALAEGWANYPVPRYMEQAECEDILRAIAPASVR
ncbi:MAG: iron-containing alcohol dehydrogenase [Candidatus Binatia bacterium]|nr:iron-containing alcohol dehydrogenase [Candidatus Binatia bacterium]MDG2011800.1 iron-containing alcohol dehydrogenase [Candidatus Binatia bacterium]